MKNIIKYYYNINAESIHRNNDEYEIYHENERYILIKYQKTLNELNEKYLLQLYLHSINVPCHRIIKNVMGETIITINNEHYVMIRTIMPNRPINLEDIIQTTKINLIEEYKHIKKDNWQKLWKVKIDYLEYEINQLNKKYPLIKESSNYYIGIVETCISLLENLNIKSLNKNIAHERIENNTTTDYFYNPLTLIIDNRTRDAGEYFKLDIYNDNYDISKIKNFIGSSLLTKEEIILLFIRLTYPSKYLDTCEQIMDKRITEKELLEIINSSQTYEMNLRKIYILIKEMIKIPEIEWLEKTNLR